MNIKEIRRANLDYLLTQFKAADIARRAETKPAYLSQIVTGVKTRGGKPRGIGDDLARKIEAGLRLPRDWMDQAHPVDRLKESAPTYIPDTLKVPALQASIHKKLAQLGEDDLKAIDMFINRLLSRPPIKSKGSQSKQ